MDFPRHPLSWLAITVLLCDATCANAGAHSGILALGRGPSSDAACALLADRYVVCWGDIFRDGTTDTTPQLVQSVFRAEDVALGSEFGCAGLLNGTASCWGAGNVGQLGDGTFASRGQAEPVGSSTPLEGVVEIAAGEEHACAATTSGNVYCWGYNDYSQIGNYTEASDAVGAPVLVVEHDSMSNPPLASVSWLALGGNTSCAMQDFKGICWGQDTDAQIGNGTAGPPLNTPTSVVKGGMSFDMISGSMTVGQAHACALVSDSRPYEVWCWGANGFGQLGNTSMSGTDFEGVPYNQSPSQVIHAGGGGLVDVASVSAGADFACALSSDHTVTCWGRNDSGQLGDHFISSDHSSTPVGVYDNAGALLGSIIEVESGRKHVCALSAGSDVFCWGDNSLGQIGGVPGGWTSTPNRVNIDKTLFTDDFDDD